MAEDEVLPTMAETLAVVAPASPSDVDDLADLEDFGPRLSLKDVRQLRALKHFLLTGKVIDACKAANVKYGTWYRWLHEDPEFALALERSKEMRANELEEIADERARGGSDTVLLALLKALKPEKYRDRQTITVVSPDVTSRLGRQADAIMEVCRMEIADTDLRAKVGTALANKLREIWT